MNTNEQDDPLGGVAIPERQCYCGAPREVVVPWTKIPGVCEKIVMRCTGPDKHEYALHRGRGD